MKETEIISLKNLTRASNVALVLAHYYNKTPGRNFQMEIHTHRYVEIMYCAKGEFIFDYFPSDGDPEHITIY
ncbi:MAG: hypothetical protein LBP26_06080, partial [Clostridiales bacterium]|nr:hypothetical protein [Clostridiales bacterium]